MGGTRMAASENGSLSAGAVVRYSDLIRLIVVSEVRIFREGLEQAIEKRPGCRVVGAVASLEESLAETAAHQPDIVLMDSGLARRPGFVQKLTQTKPSTKVVAFAVNDAEDEILECAEAGAVGYVLQQASLDELIETLRAVMRGELPCAPHIAARAFYRISRLASQVCAKAQPIELPRRQAQILALIEQGLSNKDIARRLGIQTSTVKNHVHSILTRMGVARRAQAAARVRLLLVSHSASSLDL